MRRRPAEYRRLARRRVSDWIWFLLAIFILAGLVLFVVHHFNPVQSQPPIRENLPEPSKTPRKTLNLTKELLSSNSLARQLSDQMALAKAYTIISKEHGNLKLAWEFSSQIRVCQKLLSQAATSSDPLTREQSDPLITRFAQLIYKAQDNHYDISTTLVTLKSHVNALEERSKSAISQAVKFGEIASESVQKGLSCLEIRVLEEWYEKKEIRKKADEMRNSPRLVDNNLYHFCIFSDNLMAINVVINSTVSNADHPQQLVFHVVTDQVHSKSFSSWFALNDFKGSTIEVRNVEEFSWLNSSYSPIVKKLEKNKNKSYLLKYLKFYIPEILPNLEKVVFLEDDVVVQKDLTQLFSVELRGNAIGAVETCLESYNRFYKYLNFSNPILSSKFDPQTCGWAFGVNVFDLISWKRNDITGKFHYWEDKNAELALWRGGTLPAGFLSFYGLVEPLDRRWHVLGLGFDLGIDERLIESAAVVHFSGHMKPWLKLAITRYKDVWFKYLDFEGRFVSECFDERE